MKAIIPVAGIGARLRPHTHTQPKSLIPVAGKPILAHIIDDLIKVGCDEFVFIIGYMGEKIEEYVAENYPKIKAYYTVQTAGKGTAHALWLARDLIEDDETILIVFGDTIFKADMKKVLKSPNSAVGVKKVSDPRHFGVAERDTKGFVTRLVEKPSIPKSNLALVGVYKIVHPGQLKNALAHIIDNDIKTKGEYHLTDALMYMVEQGEKIETFTVESWFDCGKKDILLETNAILLKMGGFDKPNPKDFPDSIIIPPVYLGKNVKIKHSIVGPNVSIGDNTTISYSIITNTIIGSQSELDTANVADTVMGNDASLKGATLSLNLGDSTEINIG